MMMSQDCLLPKSDYLQKSDYLCGAVKGGGSYPINRTQSPDWVDKKPRGTHSSPLCCHCTVLFNAVLYFSAGDYNEVYFFGGLQCTVVHFSVQTYTVVHSLAAPSESDTHPSLHCPHHSLNADQVILFSFFFFLFLLFSFFFFFRGQ